MSQIDLPNLSNLCQKLSSQNQTLSFVESCTGGGLTQSLAQVPGASSVLKGGVVVYQEALKIKLGVSAEDIKNHTAVSPQVAFQMAQRGRDFFKSDVCISTTGWAGPSGGHKSDPVGTVYVAVCGENIEKVERRIFTECNGRIELMKAAVDWAWDVYLRAVGWTL